MALSDANADSEMRQVAFGVVCSRSRRQLSAGIASELTNSGSHVRHLGFQQQRAAGVH